MKIKTRKLRDLYTHHNDPTARDIVTICDEVDDLTARLEAIRGELSTWHLKLPHTEYIRRHLPEPPKPKRTAEEKVAAVMDVIEIYDPASLIVIRIKEALSDEL